MSSIGSSSPTNSVVVHSPDEAVDSVDANVPKETQSPQSSQSSQSSQSNEPRTAPSGRYTARHPGRSLEDTNIRPDYCYCEDSPPLQEKDNKSEEDRKNIEGFRRPPMDKHVGSPEEEAKKKESSLAKYEERKDYCWQEKLAQSDMHTDRGCGETVDQRDGERSPLCRKKVEFYLILKDLKQKIEDLAERELHDSTRQKWVEALRLRDMRVRLELALEKRLYEGELVQLDEEARKLALEYIEKRQNELAERDNACADCTVYSEEAKVLWKKWVQEDDRSIIKEARLRRETLMKELEREFENLGTRDRERIDELYHNAIHDTSLHDRRHLTATSRTEAEISSHVGD